MRRIENGVAKVLVVNPRCEVREPHSKLKRQFARRLPGILPEELLGVVGNVIESVEIRFVVAVEVTGQQVGILVSKRKRVAR